jgi:hypothetical protein
MVSGRWIAGLASAGFFTLMVAVMPTTASALGPVKLKPAKCCPVKVKDPGSYILMGNLDPADTNNDAIKVTASNVTIDLGGFSIIGPGKSSGTGIGIDASAQTNVIVQNGTVTGMSGSGVVVGASSLVRNIVATGNGTGGSGSGIQCTGGACLVNACVATANGSEGMTFLDATSGYQDNVINGNAAGTVQLGTDMGGNVCNGVHGCP